MSTQLIHIKCPDYTFDSALDLNKVALCIDQRLIEYFYNRNVVIRGVQSEKHQVSKENLVNKILESGSDRYEEKSKHEVKSSDKPIDLFGLACIIANIPITLPILEGFHRWKPMSLEKPQLRADIWLIYEADKLENIEYNHSNYNVKARDGYIFKDAANKPDAMIGIIVID